MLSNQVEKTAFLSMGLIFLHVSVVFFYTRYTECRSESAVWDNFYPAGRKRAGMWTKLENTLRPAESNVGRAAGERR